MTLFQNTYVHLSEAMAGWDNRYRAQESLRWAPRGLAAGLALGLLMALVSRLLPLIDTAVLMIVSGVAALVGLVMALIAVWVWPRRPLAMARHFDRVFDLQERMSTAVELSEERLPVQSRELARLQLQDAVNRAQNVTASEGFPLRLQWRELLGVLLLLGALVAAIVLPNPQIAILEEQRAVQEAVSEELERLESLHDEVLNDPALSQEEREVIVETLEESIESLQRPGVTREEAVAALAAAEQQLREVAEQAEGETSRNQQALNQAGQSFDTSGLTDELGEALEQGDLDRASELLDELLVPDGAPLTEEQRQALSQELSEAADQVGDANPELAQQLRDASEALQQNNLAGADQSLSQASQQLSQTNQQLQQGQAAGQAAQQAAQQAQQGQEAIAQAGQDQQGGQGAGQGQGPGQQAGAGQGQGPGSGQQGQQPLNGGGAGTGAGTGAIEGGQTGGQMPTGNNPERDAEREYEEIYAPQRVGGGEGPVVGLPGEGDPSQDPVREGDFVENPAGEAQVPYSEVYADYADAANEALESEYVPLGMRDLVRQYFSSLNPDDQ